MHIVIIIIIKMCRLYVCVELSKILALLRNIAPATSMLTVHCCDGYVLIQHTGTFFTLL